MDFYSVLADYYELIFPYRQNKRDFLIDIMDAQSYLDIGCATGDLAAAIAQKGFDIKAIDVNIDMITRARKRHPSLLHIFHRMDMMRIPLEWKFDHIYSFGNTLAHLNGVSELGRLFRNIKHNLNRKGVFTGQILDYDYIMREEIFELPLIENDRLIFERKYDVRDDGYLDFNTNLTIKKSSGTISNSVKLYPFRKDEINSLLRDSEFYDIQFFCDYEKTEYDGESLPLIFTAKHENR